MAQPKDLSALRVLRTRYVFLMLEPSDFAKVLNLAIFSHFFSGVSFPLTVLPCPPWRGPLSLL